MKTRMREEAEKATNEMTSKPGRSLIMFIIRFVPFLSEVISHPDTYAVAGIPNRGHNGEFPWITRRSLHILPP